MPKPLVDDELWDIIKPLLPHKPRRERYPGRLPVSDRQTLTGILFVLQTGIPWEMLPQEMGCGSGMTCWRRLKQWQEAGVWDRLHQVLLSRLRAAEKLDWARAVADSSSIRAVHGEKNWTEANRHDVTQLLGLVDTIPPIAGKRGHPLQRPELVQADRGYDSEPHRRDLAARGIKTQIARRRTEHGSGLGKTRWVVERTIAWLHQFRRLRVRYERLANIHEAFLKIGCAIICWRLLKKCQISFC